MSMPSFSNLNYAWSHLMVRELLRLGVEGFFIAPGSRSSPLAWTVAELARDKMTVHFDERGLGFMALGHARATGKPAVIITTSGTAVANLFPAVCEAAMDEVPLIVITADRPPELRDCGANQAMDQVKFFGTYARWFVDVPCPAVEISPQWLLKTVDEAFSRAATGPVHLNQMFREPLAPLAAKDGANMWMMQVDARWKNKIEPVMHESVPDGLGEALSGAKRGVVIAGAAKTPDEARAMLAVAEKLGWPLLPDIRSGLRLRKPHPNIIAMADQVLLREDDAMRPDVVLHLGGKIVSKRIMKFMTTATAELIHVSGSTMRIDPDHAVTMRAVCGIDALNLPAKTRTPAKWLSAWVKRDRAVTSAWKNLVAKANGLNEPLVAALVSAWLPRGHALFLASSMPVRDMEMFGVGVHDECTVLCNRGVSGIDGTIASAVGYAHGSGKPVTLVIGDLAFLHDLNSLALIRASDVSLKIIVLNNNGGGIFSFLPVAGSPRHFETCFGTPHNIAGFEAAANLFEIPYARVETVEEFKAALKSQAVIIEVQSEREENVRLHRTYQKILRNGVVQTNRSPPPTKKPTM